MILRPALADDEAFLREMLFAALYVRPGDRPFPRSILDEPEIAHYADGFGSRAGDFGRVAIDHDEAIGACWCRVFPADDPGYGWVASETPELTVALAAGRRGDGIGAALLRATIADAPGLGYQAISLSVDPTSPALRLYERLGFVTVGTSGTSVTMRRELS